MGYAMTLRPCEVRLITFEDVTFIDDEYKINIHRSKTHEEQLMTVDIELYDEIMDYKEMKRAKGKLKYDERKISGGTILSGHFIIDIKPRALRKRFNNNFGGVLDTFNMRPKDLRMSSISTVNKEEGTTMAAKFANHKGKGVTRKHYIKSGLTLASKKTRSKASKSKS